MSLTSTQKLKGMAWGCIIASIPVAIFLFYAVGLKGAMAIAAWGLAWVIVLIATKNKS